MEPNTRDTPLRRFNTFWWGIGLYAVFAFVILIIRLVGGLEPVDPTDEERGRERSLILRQVTTEQLELRDSYADAGDGKVKVKPTDVFGLAQEMQLLDAPKASELKHNKSYQ